MLGLDVGKTTRSAVAAVAVVGLTGIGIQSAGAVTILTPTTADLLAATQINQSDAAITTSPLWEGPIGIVHVETNFSPPTTGPAFADIGDASVADGGFDADATGTEGRLWIKNTNENPWTFELFVETTVGGLLSSGAQEIAVGSSAILSVALGTLADTIESWFIRVSSTTIPIIGVNGDFDRQAEFQISSVPLPPAALLFGTGVLGLGFLARRRRKAQI